MFISLDMSHFALEPPRNIPAAGPFWGGPTSTQQVGSTLNTQQTALALHNMGNPHGTKTTSTYDTMSTPEATPADVNSFVRDNTDLMGLFALANLPPTALYGLILLAALRKKNAWIFSLMPIEKIALSQQAFNVYKFEMPPTQWTVVPPFGVPNVFGFRVTSFKQGIDTIGQAVNFELAFSMTPAGAKLLLMKFEMMAANLLRTATEMAMSAILKQSRSSWTLQHEAAGFFTPDGKSGYKYLANMSVNNFLTVLKQEQNWFAAFNKGDTAITNLIHVIGQDLRSRFPNDPEFSIVVDDLTYRLWSQRLNFNKAQPVPGYRMLVAENTDTIDPITNQNENPLNQHSMVGVFNRIRYGSCLLYTSPSPRDS